MRMTREQMLYRRVRIKKSQTSWVSVGTTGVITDIPKFGGFGVRIWSKDVIYPPGASHPHTKHEYETFHFRVIDVELVLLELEKVE